MKLEIREIVGKQPTEFESSGTGICTLFCSNKFLNYHRVKDDPSFREYRITGVIESGEPFALTLTCEKNFDSLHFVSHAGAPYGGICIRKASPAELSKLYSKVWEFLILSFTNLGGLEIRLPPSCLSAEVASHEWALWSNGFKQKTGYLGRYLPAGELLNLRKDRKRNLKKNSAGRYSVLRTTIPSPRAFEVLVENRLRRFGVEPTHSYEDLELIERNCPGMITTVELEDSLGIQAVAIVFRDSFTETLQYVANSLEAATSGIQDSLLFYFLTEIRNNDVPFLFGTSTEPSCYHQSINEGLDSYKASWGGLPYTAFRFVKYIKD